MKFKSLLWAVMAIATVAFTFSSCSNDDDGNSGNYATYQKAVDTQVRTQKKHDKAILLVAFGSTWNNAFLAFDETRAIYEKEFPDCDIYVSFSSAICINRAAAGQNTDEEGNIARRNYYAPNFWLHALAEAKYKDITVQSLQVIPGEEFARVVNYIKDFANNSLGDLEDRYLAYLNEGHIRLGAPLLSTEDEVKNVAQLLNKNYADKAAEGAVLFMGHGNPDSYDTYKANIRYTQLETELQKFNKNYFVGTVDMKDNFKQDVYARMKDAGITSGKISLHCLMSICGDHGHNDMAGRGNEYWDEDEPESEDNSWLEYFLHQNYDEVTATLLGMLEVEDIRNVWIQHTKDAEILEDFYHSMHPEE